MLELDKEMVGLHMKDVFSVQLFALFKNWLGKKRKEKNWLAVGRTVCPQVCKDPKRSEHQEYRK